MTRSILVPLVVLLAGGGAAFAGCSSSSQGPSSLSNDASTPDSTTTDAAEEMTFPDVAPSDSPYMDAVVDGPLVCPWSASDAAAPFVPDPDGGDKKLCGACIVSQCGPQWGCCANDPSTATLAEPDAAPKTLPACVAIVSCELTDIILQGAMGSQAFTDCEGADGGNYPAGSTNVGNAVMSCALLNCMSQCGFGL
jgi:hypothetical protein